MILTAPFLKYIGQQARTCAPACSDLQIILALNELLGWILLEGFQLSRGYGIVRPALRRALSGLLATIGPRNLKTQLNCLWGVGSV